MKPVVTYALVFALSLSASVFIHYFSANGSDETDLNGGMSLAQEDIARIVKYEFEEQQKSVLDSNSSDTHLFLGPLERDLADLQERQNDLLKKIEGIMDNDPLAGLRADEIVLPEPERAKEIVADAMVVVENQKQRDRIEVEAARRRDRDAARRVELEKTLTDKLRLVGDQPAKVLAVLDQVDERRNEFLTSMREAFASGERIEVDRNQMREEFTKLQDSIDTDIKNILNPDQVTLYEDYKKESPWTFGGNSMMRMGGGRRGADGEGGAGGGGGGGGFGGRGGNR